MLRKAFLVILFLVFKNGYAQKNVNTNTCFDKVNHAQLEQVLNEIDSLPINNPEKSYEYVKNILERTKQKKDLKIQVWVYEILSILSETLYSNEVKAEDYIRKAYKLLTPRLKKTYIGLLVIERYGDILSKRGELTFSLRFALELEKTLNIVCSEPNIKRYLNFIKIANIYYQKGNIEVALVNYNYAIKEAMRLKDKLWLSSGYNNRGFFFFKLGEFKKASINFKKAKTFLDEKNKEHVIFKSEIIENIAHIYLKAYKDYKTALQKYTEVSKIRRKNNREHHAILSDISRLICTTFLKLDNQSDFLIKEIESFFEKHRTINQNYLDKNFNKFYKVKLFYLNKKKKKHAYNTQTANYHRFSEGSFKYKDSIRKKTINGYIDLLNHEFEKEIALEKEVAFETEELRKKDKLIFLGVSIILLFFVFFLLFIIKLKRDNRKRLEQESYITKLKLQNSTLEKENLNKKLTSKQKDIMNMVSKSAMRIQFLSDILERLEKNITETPCETGTVKPILFDIKSQIGIEKRFMALESDLTKANAYFDDFLIEKHPNLSKTEREICFYIRLNFSIKEIAQIRNATVDSVKMTRSRIRKKLLLSQNVELDQVIQSM